MGRSVLGVLNRYASSLLVGSSSALIPVSRVVFLNQYIQRSLQDSGFETEPTFTRRILLLFFYNLIHALDVYTECTYSDATKNKT